MEAVEETETKNLMADPLFTPGLLEILERASNIGSTPSRLAHILAAFVVVFMEYQRDSKVAEVLLAEVFPKEIDL
ncbi:MAG: hypothetical protein KGI00_04925 [Candidatus Micrarchaeota archaeon]|nr:hypothetical protein [Candidatus Micrarchaeota archaeon]